MIHRYCGNKRIYDLSQQKCIYYNHKRSLTFIANILLALIIAIISILYILFK